MKMKCLCGMCVVTGTCKVRNEVVRRRVAVSKNMNGRLDLKYLMWFGHEKYNNEEWI